FRPVWNELLRAEGRVVQRGRTIGYTECDVTDENGRLIAKSNSTCLVLRGEQAGGPEPSAGTRRAFADRGGAKDTPRGTIGLAERRMRFSSRNLLPVIRVVKRGCGSPRPFCKEPWPPWPLRPSHRSTTCPRYASAMRSARTRTPASAWG